MTRATFPERIETDRLRFERISHDTADTFELYDLVRREGWREEATTHMPWFRFESVGEVAEFIDTAELQWENHETARYLLRSADENGELVGITAFGPEWDERRAGSGIVLAPEYWGREYGVERASAFVELTFERYRLDAFYSTCARGNDPSRRMIEKYVDRYGGRHEGLLRQHSTRPSGAVTDQHRFTVTREEYERATADRATLQFDRHW
ncbi:GNAT family N-acetyltransferase [Halobaculum sp. EA56]|uniref:GNAT family N-acetyltransferase n=1 Tax=Halobaculum sp. EA56 TaxID=3421648 RepID=UPI003EBA7F0F